MRTRRTAALATLFLLSSLGLGATPAGAAPLPAADPTPLAGASLYAQDSALRGALGAESAGTYVDAKSGGLVVTVTGERAAAKVRAAGGTAQVVARSAAQLAGAVQALEERAKIAGTSWGLDPRTNQIAVEADRTVSARDLARLRKVADSLGGAVRIARVPGALTKEIIGGDAIYGGGVRCSSAFNVQKGSVKYFVTAGHCNDSVAQWSATSGGPVAGVRESYSFPTNDYALVRYTDGSSPGGTVNTHNGSAQDITSAADAVVGQSLQKSGSTTKLTSGKVTAVNVTVNYGDGPVYGMVRTTACSAGGDSGGAHFAGGVALGIHSGSSGCTGTAGSAIHQPVKEALSVYGVSVY
jgi:streptogrisin D/glutamyl endopeptidase II